MALAVCGPFVAFVAGQLGGHVKFKDKLGLANGPIGFVLYEVDFLNGIEPSTVRVWENSNIVTPVSSCRFNSVARLRKLPSQNLYIG